MAYNKDELEQLALQAIEEHNTPFISHLVARLPCSSSTFYDLGLEKSESIKDALNKVRVGFKSTLLTNMMASESAAAMIASYKLLSDNVELKALNGQNVDITSKGDKIQGFEIADPNDSEDKTDQETI